MGSEKLKVLFVVHGLPPEVQGGTESYCLAAARALRDRGHEVAIICGSMRARERPEVVTSVLDGIPIRRIHRHGLFLDRWDKSFDPDVEALLERELRSLKPDVVHVHHWLRLTRTLVEVCQRSGIPAVVTLHDLWASCPRCFRIRDGAFCTRALSPDSCLACVPRDSWQSDAATGTEIELFRDDYLEELALARRVILPSEAHREALDRFTTLPPDRVQVLPHGTTADFLETSVLEQVEGERLRLGFWSHLDPMKGLHLLLEALRGLDSEERARIELHCWGRSSDKAYRQRLDRLARGLEVTWYGAYDPLEVAEVPLHWAVVPSLASESYSFVLDEAFALGIPTIVADRGALPERVGAAGLRFTAEDAASLAETIRRALSDPEIQESCRAALPALVAMSDHAVELEEVYRQVVADAEPLPTGSSELRDRRRRHRSFLIEERYRIIVESQGRLVHELGKSEQIASEKERILVSIGEYRELTVRYEEEKQELLQSCLSYQERVEGLERNARALAEARESAAMALEDYARVVGRLDASGREAREAVAEARARIDALSGEVEELRPMQQEVVALRQEVAACDRILRDRDAALLERDAALADRDADLLERNATLSEFARSIENHRELREHAENRVVDLEAAMERVDRERGGLAEHLGSARRELESAERERDRSRAALAEHEQELARRRGHWWYRLAERFAGSGSSLPTAPSPPVRPATRPGPRVLMVIHDFLPGHPAGSEIYTYNLARALLATHDVHLLFTEAHHGVHQYTVREGVYHDLPFTEVCHQHATQSFEQTWRDPRMNRIFEEVLDRVQPDLVHIQNLHNFSIDLVPITKARGIPVVFTLHEYLLLCPHGGRMLREDGEICAVPVPEKCADCIAQFRLEPASADAGRVSMAQRLARPLPGAVRRLLKGLRPAGRSPASGAHPPREAYVQAAARRLEEVRRAMAGVDLFISPSRFLRERFIAAGVARPDQIIASDNGQDLQPFEDHEREHSSRFRVGFIGTISDYKGVHVLVEAMNRLAGLADLECHIHGSLETFPDYGESLKALSANAQTYFHGGYRREEVGRVLASLDVLVVPSLWYENSPLTIHEAYLAGIPVIASDLGGMKEFVIEGKSGLRFAPGDAEALSQCIEELHSSLSLLRRLQNHSIPIKSIAQDAGDMAERYRSLLAARSAQEEA